MSYYPVNLNLKGKRCLVVGGGAVAQRKVQTLLDCGALVTVVSPTLTPVLHTLEKEHCLVYKARTYQAGDAKDYFIVICAAGDQTVNAAAAKEAKECGTLVNCVDDQALCDFFVPASVRRGDLLFTVSTGGKNPAMTKLLADELAEKYGEEYGLYLDFMAGMRKEIRSCLKSTTERELFWRTVMSPEIHKLLEEGNFAEAEAKVRDAVSSIRLKS